MTFKISPADNVTRCVSQPGRKTAPLSSRSIWAKPNKRPPLSLHQTALLAHGDINQPNNDDVVDKELEMMDWRSVRAKLVAMEQNEEMSAVGESWAHQISQPEKGCLLVCRREGLGFFHQSVIFVISHGIPNLGQSQLEYQVDDAKATTGLVLNSPSPALLENAFARGWEPGKFMSERIYFGGPVEMNSLHLLHSHGELKKCTKVIDGVYVGGFEDAQSKVEANLIPPGDFKLLVGFSSWGPYQLAQEIEDGCWYVLSSSVDIILEKAQRDGTDGFNEHLWKKVLALSKIEVPF